jgi:hypothetical protein
MGHLSSDGILRSFLDTSISGTGTNFLVESEESFLVSLFESLRFLERNFFWNN